jgi:hypothetical protein
MKFAFSSRLCNVPFSMHLRAQSLLPALLAVFFLQGFPLGASPTNKVSTDMGPVAATVARMLEQGHYLHPLSISEKNPPHPENESQQTMTERVLQNYLQMLD